AKWKNSGGNASRVVSLTNQLANFLTNTSVYSALMSPLSRTTRPTSHWVFANPKTNKPFVSIFCAWNTARTKAGLSDVRVHDLRHSFASLLINSGRSLYEVQKLLGYTQLKTTQRYAHLAPETLLAASNAATLAVGSIMGVMPNRIVDVPLVALQGWLRRFSGRCKMHINMYRGEGAN
ncbi:MAG: hypothetical protein EBX02_04230, partial [Betaproteobacteria bacterium]|nr:hypothetical protein [Betaproteobacteria bacterium]